MDTKFDFLNELERDLRGAAARDRLAIEEAERRAVAGGGPVRLGRRRRKPPAPRGRKTWVILSAASIAVLVLAGGIGFLASDQIRFNALGSGSTPAADTGSLATPAPTRAAPEDAPRPPAAPDKAGSAGEAFDNLGRRRDGSLQKIVRDGRIGIVVDDAGFADARVAISRVALENEGYVLSSSTQGRRGTFVLRVPARRFEVTLIALAELGKVEFDNRNAQIVTAEFIDLQARLRILNERKRVLVGFLRDATSVDQTLNLYNRVEDTQLEIERIQGQLRFLRDQVAEATIRVHVRERAVRVEPQPRIDNPSLGQAWERAIQGFLNILAAVVVGFGYLVPVGGLIALGWLGWRLARKRREVT